MDRRLSSFAQVHAIMSVTVAPVQYTVSTPLKVVGNISESVRSRHLLLQENAKLKKEQLRLQTRLQRLTSIEAENQYLKSLLHSSRQVQGKTLIAQLLAVASEPFVHQVVLDKGSRDGVYVGQPVLDAGGVLGQVTNVSLLTSRVLLISDSRSGVAVQNVRSGTRAIAVGDNYSDRLRLMYVSKTADIRVGDDFLTSGLGDRYPEGYPVGVVISVIKDPTHQFAEIILQPSAHLDTSRQVLLIWNTNNV